MRSLYRACRLWLRLGDEKHHALPPNERLTRNFDVAEMCRSGTARRKGIDNKPPLEAVEALRELCVNVLQPARDAKGAIAITSGFRNSELNRAVRGARNSDHLYGRAADIVPTGSVSLIKLGAWIQNHTKFKQLIYEHGEWLHVSYDSEELRNEILEAYRVGRQVKYRPFRFKP